MTPQPDNARLLAIDIGNTNVVLGIYAAGAWPDTPDQPLVVSSFCPFQCGTQWVSAACCDPGSVLLLGESSAVLLKMSSALLLKVSSAFLRLLPSISHKEITS